MSKIVKYGVAGIYALSGAKLAATGKDQVTNNEDATFCGNVESISLGFNQLCGHVDQLLPENKIQIGIGMIALSYALFAKARNEATINHQAIYIEGLLRSLKKRSSSKK